MSAWYSCREAMRLSSEALDHPLSLRGRIELRVHLAVCGACRAFRRQVNALDRLVRAHAGDLAAGGAALSPAARERIHAALRARLDES